jgi:hypothetical protein
MSPASEPMLGRLGVPDAVGAGDDGDASNEAVRGDIAFIANGIRVVADVSLVAVHLGSSPQGMLQRRVRAKDMKDRRMLTNGDGVRLPWSRAIVAGAMPDGDQSVRFLPIAITRRGCIDSAAWESLSRAITAASSEDERAEVLDISHYVARLSVGLARDIGSRASACLSVLT